MKAEIKRELALATARGNKVLYMNMWFAENVKYIIGLNTKEREEFALSVFGSKSYTTEMAYAIKMRGYIKIDPCWRIGVIGVA